VVELQAPFPWFGGKSTVATEIWLRFGYVRNYIEPFFGSGAVLLARPTPFEGVETINDKDRFVANFWRAVHFDSDAVTAWCDWPVNETDLESRHYWLITDGTKRLESILGDPLGFDAQIAGWWCWGICSWIGSGWCAGKGPWQWTGEAWAKRDGAGVNRQLPHLGNAGMGINRQRPHLGNAGRGDFIRDWFRALSERLRGVRVCSGDWSRVCGDSVTTKHGLTAVFLDPPYSAEANRDRALYSTEDLSVAHDVRRWALERGNDRLYRICLAGYEGEHEMPGWTALPWKARGGFGSQGEGRGRENAAREVLWFNPHCLRVGRVVQGGLFSGE